MDFNKLSNADLLTMICGKSGRALAKRPLIELFGFRQPIQQDCVMREDASPYVVNAQLGAAKELIIRASLETMQELSCFLSPESVSTYLIGKIGHLEYEVFYCLFLNVKNELINAVEMFRGTVTQTSVYPREVVKKALAVNATGVILAHNHPSGGLKPSRADEMLTKTLKEALQLVDVIVLDHVIVSGANSMSFAEKGLI